VYYEIRVPPIIWIHFESNIFLFSLLVMYVNGIVWDEVSNRGKRSCLKLDSRKGNSKISSNGGRRVTQGIVNGRRAIYSVDVFVQGISHRRR
jgi:hypothetical protein